MTAEAMSRRQILEASACLLIATAAFPHRARAATGLRPRGEEVVRNYYAAWETKDWPRLDRLLAGGFTFSSPLDDRIGKSAYKSGCWDTQSPLIARFDLMQVMATEAEAFVLYICHTENAKTFHNVEYFRFARGQVEAVECYFGGKASFPSAVSAGKG